MTLGELKSSFPTVWLVDIEFHQPDGERPKPICVVAKELFSNRTIRQWLWDSPTANPPFGLGPRDLYVAYLSTAEFSCHLALNWPLPLRCVDLYAEFRLLTCGVGSLNGHGLLGALSYFGLPGLESAAKEDMRALAIRGGRFSSEEQRALLNYCETDVLALKQLLPAMLPHIDLPRALIRGEYMAALAWIERQGVPIDVDRYRVLCENWSAVQLDLIRRIDADYNVYEGTTFKVDRFKSWLASNRIEWPTLDSGALSLTEETFRDMSKSYPIVGPLKELRATLGQFQLGRLSVGSDGRNRCLLSPFASRTSRNQPSNTKFIFGPAVWVRFLIKPAEGQAVAYVDYEQQEFGIAAALSGDEAMKTAYRSGDPYLAFAKQAGAVPPSATAATHRLERELFKICALAVQYGMGEASLGARMGQSPAHGRELIEKHRRTYPAYWGWSEAVQEQAMLNGSLEAAYGWRMQTGPGANPRSLRNFPVQANGAEMLRLAIILAHQRGVQICAPIHDALLIEAHVDGIMDAVTTCQDAMRQASELVLPDFPLRTDVRITRWPDRYTDGRGAKMWSELWEIPLLKSALTQSELARVGGSSMQQPCSTRGLPLSII
jgi:DNA polymerase I